MAVPPQPETRSPWKTLYAIIWIVFVQILIALVVFPGSIYLHVALGFAIVFLAHYHQSHIKRMAIPDRIRRIVRSTASLASAQFVLGIYAFLVVVLGWSLPGLEVVLVLHLVVALAILSQASSAATAYDMWEEREFERVEVPTPRA
ncbi:MAG TPA: hypothetical protein VEY12_02075 [Thermoplasmata archaeon]|nr:hypothetical protein [Thermoplasmata archaeon]